MTHLAGSDAELSHPAKNITSCENSVMFTCIVDRFKAGLFTPVSQKVCLNTYQMSSLPSQKELVACTLHVEKGTHLGNALRSRGVGAYV